VSEESERIVPPAKKPAPAAKKAAATPAPRKASAKPAPKNPAAAPAAKPAARKPAAKKPAAATPAAPKTPAAAKAPAAAKSAAKKPVAAKPAAQKPVAAKPAAATPAAPKTPAAAKAPAAAKPAAKKPAKKRLAVPKLPGKKELAAPSTEMVKAQTKKFRLKANKYKNDPEKADQLLREAKALALKNPGPMASRLQDLATLIRMIRAYTSGAYRDVPWETVALAIGAVMYFVNPMDVIPDVIPGFGYVDDAAVVAFVVASITNDIHNFREWEAQVEFAEG